MFHVLLKLEDVSRLNIWEGLGHFLSVSKALLAIRGHWPLSERRQLRRIGCSVSDMVTPVLNALVYPEKACSLLMAERTKAGD